jgi:hypothetical protein
MQLTNLIKSMLEKLPYRRPYIDEVLEQFPQSYRIVRELDANNLANYWRSRTIRRKRSPEERRLEREFQELKAALTNPSGETECQEHVRPMPTINSRAQVVEFPQCVPKHRSLSEIRGTQKRARVNLHLNLKLRLNLALALNLNLHTCTDSRLVFPPSYIQNRKRKPTKAPDASAN